MNYASLKFFYQIIFISNFNHFKILKKLDIIIFNWRRASNNNNI